MDPEATIQISPSERIRRALRSARLWLIFIGALIGTTIAISIPVAQDTAGLGLEEGDVASVDIVAPSSLTFTSEIMTEQARLAAELAIPDVFDPPNSQIARAQLEQLRASINFVNSVRTDTFATDEQKIRDLMSLATLQLSEDAAQELLTMPQSRWESISLEAITVLEQVMRSEIREERLDETRRIIPTLVSISIPDSQAEAVVSLVEAFVVANSTFNEGATLAARQAARDGVAPVLKSYAADETIVGRGQVVVPLHIEALQEFGLLQPTNPLGELAIRGLLVTVLGSAFVLYAVRVHPSVVQDTRTALVLALMFIIIALSLAFMVPGRTVLPYLFPAASAPMLLAVIFSPGVGIMASVTTAALGGFLATRGFELNLYILMAGIVGALMIGRANRLSTFFWAGLSASIASLAIVVIFRYPDPTTDLIGKLSLTAASFLMGLLSASLGFALLLLVSSILGITTSLQLIDLARPDHPLLQVILREAPGTYQHSLQVANLSEQAARSIGANALLTRVGALYHDCGKSLRPQFFVENQVSGQNIHEQLDPKTSASVILAHVTDGLELARKYRLPRSIRAFIAEHHGTMVALYQYQAALKAADGETEVVDERDFTYRGPRPRSKETGLVMLADGVEAKARADMPKDEHEIDKLVHWIIQDRLNKGQLDRTDLTLKDLDLTRQTFVNTLKGIYHPRIRYPGPSVETGSVPTVKSPAPTRSDA